MLLSLKTVFVGPGADGGDAISALESNKLKLGFNQRRAVDPKTNKFTAKSNGLNPKTSLLSSATETQILKYRVSVLNRRLEVLKQKLVAKQAQNTVQSRRLPS